MFRFLSMAITLALCIGSADALELNSWELSQKKTGDFDHFWSFNEIGEDGVLVLPAERLDQYRNDGGTVCDNGANAPQNGCDGEEDFTFYGTKLIQDDVLTLTSGWVLSEVWETYSKKYENTPINDGFNYTIAIKVRAVGTTGKGLSIYDTPNGSSSVGGISISSDNPNNQKQHVYYGINSVGNESFKLLSKPKSTLDDNGGSVPYFIDIRMITSKIPGELNHQYSLIIDGQRVGTFMDQHRAIGSLHARTRLAMGDIGSQHDGDLVLDEFGFTDGYHAPDKLYLNSDLVPNNVSNEGNHMEVAPFPTPSLITMRAANVCGAPGFQFAKSTDDGSSWIPKGCIPEGPTKFNIPIIRQIDDLNYVMIYRDSLSESQLTSGRCSTLGQCQTPEDYQNTPAEFLPSAKYKVWSIRSYNGGQSWKDRCLISGGFTGDIKDFTIANNVINPNGPKKIIVPLSVADLNTNRIVTKVYTSDAVVVGSCSNNSGSETWVESDDTLDIVDYNIDARGTEDGFLEPTVTQRPDGVLEMYMRTTQGNLWRSLSFDSGLNWEAATESEITSSSTHGFVVTLSDGRLAMLYSPEKPQYENGVGDAEYCFRSHRQNEANDASVCREELNLIISNDDGKSWSDPILLAASAGHEISFRMFEKAPGRLAFRIGGDWYSMSTP